MSDAQRLWSLSWVLLCAGLVLLMRAGFTCLETGFARAKNSINVALKNVVDFCIAAVVFWLFGFALMFGTSAWGLVGTDQFLPGKDAQSVLLAFFLFQLVFCGTATTIIPGTVKRSSKQRTRRFRLMRTGLGSIHMENSPHMRQYPVNCTIKPWR